MLEGSGHSESSVGRTSDNLVKSQSGEATLSPKGGSILPCDPIAGALDVGDITPSPFEGAILSGVTLAAMVSRPFSY